ncbi:MAG: hypothetical protein R6T93_14600 [Trueperaceae bacterium]
MTRAALLTLVAVVLGLFALTLLPDRRPDLPDATIALADATVVLMPEADPEAVWTFSAPTARFDPDRDTTELFDVEDGARTVGGVVDFTLSSERLVIDRRDDLVAERIDAHLVADGWDVLMEGRDQRNVLVRQDVGRFEVPHVEITGEGIGRSVYQDMRISFDFTDFQAGGPGTVGTSAFVADVREP